MKLPTKLVAVKKISSGKARSSFSTQEIDQAAQLIIAVEGIINPIILRRTSFESYEVIAGHFEYYAAVKAREISPLKGEMIQGIILEPENEEKLLEQVELLRKGDQQPSIPTEREGDLETRFANLEKIFQSQFEELRKENRELKRLITEIASKDQNPISQGELVDAIALKITEAVRLFAPTGKGSRKKSLDELKQNPLELNSASKGELMTIPGIGEKTAASIVERRKTQGNFTRVEELTQIDKVTQTILDKYQWCECLIIKDSSGG